MTPLPTDKYAGYSQMSMSPNLPGLSTGNPTVDMLLSMLLNNSSFAPRQAAGSGRSIYEGYLLRQRSLDFQRVMSQGLGASPALQALGGMSSTSENMARVLAMMTGGPTGIMNTNLVRSLNSGNMMQAYTGMHRDLTGYTLSAGFNRHGSADIGMTTRIMQGHLDAMYRRQIYTRDHVDQREQQVGQQLSSRLDRDKDFRKTMSRLTFKDEEGNRQFDMNQFEELRKATKDFTEDLKGWMTDAFIEEAKGTLKKFNRGELTKRIGQSMPAGINYQTTMGFEAQELTKAFTTSIDLGLINTRKHIAQYQLGGYSREEAEVRVARNTVENRANVMRSYSDLTGATGVDNIMAGINEFIGTSRIDIGTDDGQRYVDDLMRRVKGTARTAGVGIEAMLSIIRTVKGLSQQYSSTAEIGGLGATEIAVSSIQKSMASAKLFGMDFIRTQGGIQGWIDQGVQTEMALRNEPIAQRMQGLLAGIHYSDAFSPEARHAAITRIQEFASDPHNRYSTADENELYEQLARITGTSVHYMQRMGRSELNQSLFSQKQEELDRMGILKFDPAGLSRNVHAGRARSVINNLVRNDGILRDIPEHLVADHVFSEIGRIGITNKTYEQVIAEMGLANSEAGAAYFSDPLVKRALMDHAAANHPEGIREQLLMKQDIERFAETDAAISKRAARLHTDILPSLGSELLAGTFKEKGFAALKEMLELEPSQIQADKVGRLLAEMNSLKTNEGYVDAMRTLTGEAHPERLAALTVENINALTDLGAAGVTIQDLQSYANVGKNNRANHALAQRFGKDKVDGLVTVARRLGLFKKQNRKYSGSPLTNETLRTIATTDEAQSMVEMVRNEVLADSARVTRAKLDASREAYSADQESYEQLLVDAGVARIAYTPSRDSEGNIVGIDESAYNKYLKSGRADTATLRALQQVDPNFIIRKGGNIVGVNFKAMRKGLGTIDTKVLDDMGRRGFGEFSTEFSYVDFMEAAKNLSEQSLNPEAGRLLSDSMYRDDSGIIDADKVAEAYRGGKLTTEQKQALSKYISKDGKFNAESLHQDVTSDSAKYSINALEAGRAITLHTRTAEAAGNKARETGKETVEMTLDTLSNKLTDLLGSGGHLAQHLLAISSALQQATT